MAIALDSPLPSVCATWATQLDKEVDRLAQGGLRTLSVRELADTAVLRLRSLNLTRDEFLRAANHALALVGKTGAAQLPAHQARNLGGLRKAFEAALEQTMARRLAVATHKESKASTYSAIATLGIQDIHEGSGQLSATISSLNEPGMEALRQAAESAGVKLEVKKRSWLGVGNRATLLVTPTDRFCAEGAIQLRDFMANSGISEYLREFFHEVSKRMPSKESRSSQVRFGDPNDSTLPRMPEQLRASIGWVHTTRFEDAVKSAAAELNVELDMDRRGLPAGHYEYTARVSGRPGACRAFMDSYFKIAKRYDFSDYENLWKREKLTAMVRVGEDGWFRSDVEKLAEKYHVTVVKMDNSTKGSGYEFTIEVKGEADHCVDFASAFRAMKSSKNYE